MNLYGALNQNLSIVFDLIIQKKFALLVPELVRFDYTYRQDSSHKNGHPLSPDGRSNAKAARLFFAAGIVGLIDESVCLVDAAFCKVCLDLRLLPRN